MSMHRISFAIGRLNLDGFTHFDLGTDPQTWEERTARLPQADASAERLVVADCLHRLGRRQGLVFLRECRRILRPGGELVVSVPDPEAAAGTRDAGHWSAVNRLAFEAGWQWFFTEAELRETLVLAGFDTDPTRPAWAAALGLEPDGDAVVLGAKRRGLPESETEPLVSVLIPAYKSTWFEEALRSACAQTYRNIEIVVCDDSGGEEIARISHALDDPRLRYERNPQRLGARGNYMRCLELARGTFVKFLNDDDRLAPRCVERLLGALLAEPGARLAASRREIIDAEGRRIDEVGLMLPADAVLEGRSLAEGLLTVGRNLLGEPSTVLFRRADVAGVRPYALSLDGEPTPGIGDLALWVRLLGQGECVYLTEALSAFRVHEAQHQRAPEVQGRVEASWEALRARAARLGLHDPEHWDRHLHWRPTGESHWRETAWQEVDPTSGTASDAAAALHGALQPVVEEDYALWRRKHSLEVIEGELFAERMMLRWRQRPAFHLVMQVLPGEETLLADTLDSLSIQLYPHWGLTVVSPQPCPQPAFEELPNLEWIEVDPEADPAAAVNLAVAETGADWVAWIPPGLRLAPEILIKCGDYVQIRPDWCFIYTDSDRLDERGERCDPRFRPDFNLDLLRAMPYMGPFALVRSDALWTCGGYPEGGEAAAWELAFRVWESFGDAAMGHIADVLYHEPAQGPAPVSGEAGRAVVEAHLRRCRIDATVEPGLLPGTQHVRYRHPGAPLVSVVVHTRDKLEYLEPCVESLFSKTRYAPFELIVVDNQSEDPDTLAYLAALESRFPERVSVIRYPRPFNYAAQSNLAARHARGAYLLFLNNDTQIVQAEWLDELMAHAQRPDVGAVGARLVYPETGRLQHAGVVLGMGQARLADHPYLGLLELDDPGYLGRAQVAQELSAVTGACLLVRADLYRQAGGMDEEHFAVLYNDVDLCLKLGEMGYRVVWTPHATLVHHGSASLSEVVGDPSGAAQRAIEARREDRALVARWRQRLAEDPAYNRHLSLQRREASVESEVVINWDPNFHDRPRILGVASGGGSGEYRVIHPLRALSRAGHAQTDVVQSKRYLHTRVPTLGELLRARADTLLVHAALADVELALLERARELLDLELVYGLDDLVTAVPEKSSAYRRFTGSFRDARRRLRAALRHCHRAVVTTTPLAELCAAMIDDVRVIPNYLERDIWGRHEARRREHARPRVGWAGAQQHQGDLELMVPVVEATAGEVDWVFFGMCPEALRPYAAEVHAFEVGYEDYVAKLAGLDLDLAVAPLELNPFNEAKSNLRILEYGYFGWPVVCTDILPYQGAPVTRVPNDPRRWIEALRERIHDPEAARAEGRALQDWVRNGWMLEDRLEAWVHALVGPVATTGREDTQPHTAQTRLAAGGS